MQKREARLRDEKRVEKGRAYGEEKTCLPPVVMGNVRSLCIKMDKLTALTWSHMEYWVLMCFSQCVYMTLKKTELLG